VRLGACPLFQQPANHGPALIHNAQEIQDVPKIPGSGWDCAQQEWSLRDR